MIIPGEEATWDNIGPLMAKLRIAYPGAFSFDSKELPDGSVEYTPRARHHAYQNLRDIEIVSLASG